MIQRYTLVVHHGTTRIAVMHHSALHRVVSSNVSHYFLVPLHLCASVMGLQHGSILVYQAWSGSEYVPNMLDALPL
jgi:hypothetical protein